MGKTMNRTLFDLISMIWFSLKVVLSMIRFMFGLFLVFASMTVIITSIIEQPLLTVPTVFVVVLMWCIVGYIDSYIDRHIGWRDS